MISRVASTCFWLQRQMERADAMARLLRVNQAFVLDAPIPAERKWYPLLVVAGEHERFDETHGAEARAKGELVREFLTWDRNSPVSIVSAVYWARENARMIRDVVSLDMWEVVNDLWHWLSRGNGRRAFNNDPDTFYRYVTGRAAMFQGVSQNTMLHETAFDFMQLGMLLERAGQTARVLDVHHHTFDDAPSGDESTALARLQWLSLLRSCSGTGPFLRRSASAPTASRVLGFLVLDEHFPRSVLHCIERARLLLKRVRPSSEIGEASWQQLDGIRGSLMEMSSNSLHERGPHDELTRIVDAISGVCDALHTDYFDPPAPRIETTEAVRAGNHAS